MVAGDGTMAGTGGVVSVFQLMFWESVGDWAFFCGLV